MKNRWNRDNLTLALCIALFPPIWAVLSPKLGIEVGAVALMPLASPSGSNKGLQTRDFIQDLIRTLPLPIIVDAGIGCPSQACEAMELGCAAVMANTALATADDLNLMADAFRMAIEAGRAGFLSHRHNRLICSNSSCKREYRNRT